MALLSTLYNDTLTEAPGVPYPLVLRELRLALERFCHGSLFWRFVLPPIMIDAGEVGVTIPGVAGGTDVDFTTYIPVDTIVSKIIHATYNTFPIAPSSIELTNQHDSRWESKTSAFPEFIELINGCTLVPSPSGMHNFVATVALCPAHTSLDIDDSIIVSYRQTIIDGALAQLLLMVGKPWANPDLAPYYETNFQKGVNMARIAMQQDNHAKKRVTPYGGIGQNTRRNFSGYRRFM